MYNVPIFAIKSQQCFFPIFFLHIIRCFFSQRIVVQRLSRQIALKTLITKKNVKDFSKQLMNGFKSAEFSVPVLERLDQIYQKKPNQNRTNCLIIFFGKWPKFVRYIQFIITFCHFKSHVPCSHRFNRYFGSGSI